jgi:hypothetical protein
MLYNDNEATTETQFLPNDRYGVQCEEQRKPNENWESDRRIVLMKLGNARRGKASTEYCP